MSDNYKILSYIARGIGGKVFKGENNITKNIVAIKSIEFMYRRRDLYKRLYREICILKHLDSRYTLSLMDLYGKYENGQLIEVCLILPFMDYDLKSITRDYRLFYAQIIRIIYQLLMGLKYLSESGIIHRDLKPSNIGINSNLDLKILDFGLARDKQDDLTDYVVTRYYRPLEVFCTSQYTMAVDMWSAGCILSELCTQEVLFPGKDKTDQCKCILKIIGFPSDEMLSKMNNKNVCTGLALFKSISAPSNQLENRIRKQIELNFEEESDTQQCSDNVITMINMMLKLDPDERITPIEALNSPLFSNDKDFLSSYSENGNPREFKCLFLQEDAEDYCKDEIINEINNFTRST